MSGGGNDHVVAGHIPLGQVVAIDSTVGDHRGEIVARIGAPVRADLSEVRAEIVHDGLDHARKLLRAECLL